jgi:hypothetical protein
MSEKGKKTLADEIINLAERKGQKLKTMDDVEKFMKEFRKTTGSTPCDDEVWKAFKEIGNVSNK